MNPERALKSVHRKIDTTMDLLLPKEASFKGAVTRAICDGVTLSIALDTLRNLGSENYGAALAELGIGGIIGFGRLVYIVGEDTLRKVPNEERL